jgi:hypothetical protein
MPNDDLYSTIDQHGQTVERDQYNAARDVNIYQSSAIPSPQTDRERRNRERMLQKVRQFWVEGVLHNSLHHEVIKLGMYTYPESVPNPFHMIIEYPNREPRPLPADTSMAQVFDTALQRLLILGAPGAGKTTMLLDLASALLERAEQDDTHPMPVVFNLSSWAEQQQPLDQWLTEELNLRYDVPRKVAAEWVAAHIILPLLDGLDEVAREQRAACVKAINDYCREQNPPGVVVCSRLADYREIGEQAALEQAVVLQPLSDAQIDAHLAAGGNELAGVRQALQQDKELLQLLQLVRVPLLLTIVTLAYQGADTSGLVGQPPAEQRRRLFDSYVQRMLARRPATKDTRYPPEQTRHWLTWLAARMVERSQTVFYIERMQPDWLTYHRGLYRLLAGTFTGLLVGFLVGLGVGMNVGMSFGLGFALIVALRDVKTVESVHWSWQHALAHKWWQLPLLTLGIVLADGFVSVIGSSLPVAFIFGLSFGIIFGLSGGMVFGLAFGLVFGLVFALSGGLISGVGSALYLVGMDGIVSDEVQIKIQPNEGIRRSMQSAGLVGIIGAIVAGMASGIFGLAIGDWLFGVHSGLLFGLGFGLVVGGGAAVIKHYTLRFLLWRQGFIPRDYISFLDYAAERILLRKVGGGYIFVHRMLLEYFADLEERR